MFQLTIEGHALPAAGQPQSSRSTRARSASETRALERDAIERFPGVSDLQLQCLAGCLWITHDGDPKDVILAPGQICDVRERRRVLIHALEFSTYVIRRASTRRQNRWWSLRRR